MGAPVPSCEEDTAQPYTRLAEPAALDAAQAAPWSCGSAQASSLRHRLPQKLPAMLDLCMAGT